MVPEGWQSLRFDKIVDLVHGFQFRDHHFCELGIPIVKIGNLVADGGVDFSKASNVPFSAKDEFAKFALDEGDILMALTGGTLGKMSRVQPDFPLAFQNYRVGNFKPHDERQLSKKYLYYILASALVQNLIQDRVNEAAQPNIGKGDFGTIVVNLPPLPEQRKIADILSTWDAAIEKTEALLATAKAQKRALMQSLLTGKRRFPEFEGQPWKEVRLGDVADTWSGGTPSRTKPEYYNGTIPWIKSGEVNANRVVETQEFISEAGLKNSSAKLVEPNTVLIAMYGATAGVVSVSDINAAINQAILAVHAKPEIDPTFLLFAIQAQMDQTKRLTQGGQPNLNAGIIRASKIGVPSMKEQQLIADVVSDTATEIAAAADQITKLRTEKKALMQQLLTGKRRVAVEENHGV